MGLVAIGFIVFGKNYTFKKEVAYEPCEVHYGDTVGSWEGSGAEPWDEQGYHYEAKQFLLSAKAPKSFFANVAETPPNQLVSSNIDGVTGCQPDFDGLVDTNSDTYQWYGALPMATRLGAPDLGDVNNAGRLKTSDAHLKPNTKLSPPVFSNSELRAAAMVDDGAQAVVQSEDRKNTQLLWCQGQPNPLNPDGHCSDITAAGSDRHPLRGEGYLFAADNCPLKDCTDVESWYRGNEEANFDYTNLIGTNERGELLPYYLHLSAVSTYANNLGTWMVATFKYPVAPQINNSVAANPKTVAAGATFNVVVTLSKIGPDISELSILPVLENQPIKPINDFSESSEALEQLNNNEQVSFSAQYQLTGGTPGQCFELPINVEAIAVSPNPDSIRSTDPHKITAETASARYCIEQPGARTSYSYEVNSRGAIQTDINEFIAQAGESLVSSLGWGQAGVSFNRVASGGDFTLVLSSPDQMTTFSSGCDAIYSCRAGRFVIINDERWRTATPSWNNAGGSLRDYRHMVINHEVGHWLGFGHLQCPAAGSMAPVMQQQSISLQGCAFNPWPTAAEIATLKARL